MFDSVGNFYFGESLQHYGVIGMHWGVRRYQPYDTVPRGSGEGGKEIGKAAKIAKRNKKTAKNNITSALKKATRNDAGYVGMSEQGNDNWNKRYNKKLRKLVDENGHISNEKAFDKLQKKNDKVQKYNEKERQSSTYKRGEAAMKELDDVIAEAESVIGKEAVDKILKKVVRKSAVSDAENFFWLPPVFAGPVSAMGKGATYRIRKRLKENK